MQAEASTSLTAIGRVPNGDYQALSKGGGRDTTEDGKNDTQVLYAMPVTFDEKWKPLFEKFDVNGDGKISMEAFQVILYKYGLKEAIESHKLSVLESTIEENTGGYIGYHEFLNIMSEKRTLSFSLAVRTRLNDCAAGHFYQFTTDNHMTRWQYCLKLIGNEFLTNDNDRANFTSSFRWCLPPVLIIFMCLIEIGFYIYCCIAVTDFDLMTGPIPLDSTFIFDPVKRIELWRFFTYFVFHAGLEHLLFNLVFQLFIGLPLEFVHGSRRIGTILFFGILAGSMGSSVLDPSSYVCGISAGVYALMAGHLANRLTHYSRIRDGSVKLGIIVIFASGDFGVAVWRRFSTDALLPISFVPHLMGVVVGLTFGLLILRNYDQKLYERFTMWIAMMLWCLTVLFVVLWNVFYKLKPIDVTMATEVPD